jgi:hypothetical protein
MKITFSILALLVLTACAANGYQNMTPEQIAATAKMKDANINCVIIASPWGKGVTTFLNLDKGVLPVGTITVDSECRITIRNQEPAPRD